MRQHHHSKSSAHDPTFTAKSRSTGEILRRVAVYLKPYKWMAAGTIGCALLSIIFSLVYPKLTQYIIDDVIRQKDAKRLTTIMLALLGAFLLRDLFNSLRILINNTLEQNVIYDMRRDVYARLQRLPVNYFDQRASGRGDCIDSVAAAGRRGHLVHHDRPSALPRATRGGKRDECAVDG
jgi:ABC-type multidrug transport system fused ATPase/permease subunit